MNFPINNQEEFDAAVAEIHGDIAGLKNQVTTLTTERDTLQGKVKGFETDALKRKIAQEKGIPMDMASRLTGDDEKALRADADSMAGMLKAYKGPAPLHDPAPKDPDPKTADMTSMLRDLRGE